MSNTSAESEDAAIIVLCTAPADGEQASTLARGLVQERLAACVNILPGIRSFYSWQGKLHDDQEQQLLIKTRASLFPGVQAFLREHHPYEVPEIVALPVTAISSAYRSWLFEQTRS